MLSLGHISFWCVFKCLVCIFVCFFVSLDHFGFVLLVSVVGFGFSVPSQEIGWEERLRNYLFCVDLDSKNLLHHPS